MASWRLVDKPVRIPAPGGKLIEELFGRVSTETEGFSLAHMVAPPQWAEPAQTPAFGELTVMIRGRMHIEAGDERQVIELLAGQAFWIDAGVRVRYSNPYEQQAEYFAICIPAFAPGLANRDEG